MKTTLFILVCLFTYTASGQIADSLVELTLKRSIWFYPKTTEIARRFTLGTGQKVFYIAAPGQEFLRARHKNELGFVEAIQVSNDFQSGGLPIISKSKAQASPVEINTAIINEAGTRIKTGASMVIGGLILGVAAGAAGYFVGKKNPETANLIYIGGGVLSISLQIGGLANIVGGGSKLSEYGK